MYSPRPTSGYDNSWIKGAMQAYADQQNAAFKAALAELIEGSEVFRKSFIVAVGEASPYAKMSLIQIDRPLDHAKKLLDKQPQSESDKTE